jgi:TPR repeat protein
MLLGVVLLGGVVVAWLLIPRAKEPPPQRPLQEIRALAFVAVITDDYDTAAPLLKTLAEKGDTLAQSTLGSFYLKGLGVKRNFLEAAEWFGKSFGAGQW